MTPQPPPREAVAIAAFGPPSSCPTSTSIIHLFGCSEKNVTREVRASSWKLPIGLPPVAAGLELSRGR
jgi:hypothetical protein